ncbi:hypothetical protein [Pseudonocardia oroxyli]|nr:hypothetical protein [Pseudonocardia oroxyli]
MATLRSSLTKELRSAGLTRSAIDGVWPEWWSDEAEQSVSAVAELRFTVARRLGISPGSLFEGEPKFVWRDSAKFKNLGDATIQEQDVLSSFGVAVARALIAGTPPGAGFQASNPEFVRGALLDRIPHLDMRTVLSLCWDMGVPVIKANLLPLRRKLMQAMSVRVGDRYAILIGRDSSHPAWVLFIIAHELGHISNGDLVDGSALLEMADPLEAEGQDNEEHEADRFALKLLTGQANFQVLPSIERYNSAEVVQAVTQWAPQLRVDPGFLALSLAHSTGRWRQSMTALRHLPGQYFEDLGGSINWLASERLEWDSLSDERASYIRAIMGAGQ